MKSPFLTLSMLIALHASLCHADDAITNGLQFLSKAGPEFQGKKGCITCHHGPMTQWASNAGSGMASAVDITSISEVDQKLRNRFKGGKGKLDKKNWWRPVQAAFWILGQPDDWNPADDPDATDVLVEAILRHQNDDGSWTAAKQFTGQRRPKGEAHLMQTMWNVLALERVGADDTSVVESRDRAVKWIENANDPQGSDVRAVRLMLEHRLGTQATTQEVLDTILAAQNDDGSWSWLPDEEGDVWATGITLYALGHLRDNGMTSDAVAAARQFLVRKQTDDGSWKVPTKLKGDHNSVISSYFGTAWSVIGLAHTAPAIEAE